MPGGLWWVGLPRHHRQAARQHGWKDSAHRPTAQRFANTDRARRNRSQWGGREQAQRQAFPLVDDPFYPMGANYHPRSMSYDHARGRGGHITPRSLALTASALRPYPTRL